MKRICRAIVTYMVTSYAYYCHSICITLSVTIMRNWNWWTCFPYTPDDSVHYWGNARNIHDHPWWHSPRSYSPKGKGMCIVHNLLSSWSSLSHSDIQTQLWGLGLGYYMNIIMFWDYWWYNLLVWLIYLMTKMVNPDFGIIRKQI